MFDVHLKASGPFAETLPPKITEPSAETSLAVLLYVPPTRSPRPIIPVHGVHLTASVPLMEMLLPTMTLPS